MNTWDFNYTKVDEQPLFSQMINAPNSRGESHPNPFKVFVDVYDAIKNLTQPGNMQLRGRRGIGKTMYLLNAQRKLEKEFLREGKIISAYVDLYDLSEFSQMAQSSPFLSINVMYKVIILSILDGQYTDEGKAIHLSRDLSGLVKNTSWYRRRKINKEIMKLKNYLEGLGDPISTREEYKQIIDTDEFLGLSGQASLGLDLSGPSSEINSGMVIKESEEIKTQSHLSGIYVYRPQTVKKHLNAIIKAIGVEHFIVFIDEFSAPSIPWSFQPYVLRKLLETFNGSRFSFKIATIPGASSLSARHPTLGHIGIQADHRLGTFDFDNEAAKRPIPIKTGNLHVFLKNLAFFNNQLFSQYVVDNDMEKQSGFFEQFIKDYFQDIESFKEFQSSGEGLPRQLFDTFLQAYPMMLQNKRPLNKFDVWLAAFRDYDQKEKVELSNDKDCKDVIASINQTGSRVFKLERDPSYSAAIELLTAFGFINACPVPSTREDEISDYPLEYYYTSYRTEAAIQMARFYFSKQEPPINFHIEDMTFVPKSRISDLYPKAKPVLLTKHRETNKARKKTTK